MLLDIHTHHNAAVPGESIFNVEPAWFEPAEGCYYSIGIHPWKVLETGPEDWTTAGGCGWPSICSGDRRGRSG